MPCLHVGINGVSDMCACIHLHYALIRKSIGFNGPLVFTFVANQCLHTACFLKVVFYAGDVSMHN